jgi:hypothetical protein
LTADTLWNLQPNAPAMAWLYRVQSDRSFTIWNEYSEFKARRRRQGTYEDWVTKSCIEMHLEWRTRTYDLLAIRRISRYLKIFVSYNPCLSMCSLWLTTQADDADKRAKFLVQQGHSGVFIAVIELPSPFDAKLPFKDGPATSKFPLFSKLTTSNARVSCYSPRGLQEST